MPFVVQFRKGLLYRSIYFYFCLPAVMRTLVLIFALPFIDVPEVIAKVEVETLEATNRGTTGEND